MKKKADSSMLERIYPQLFSFEGQGYKTIKTIKY